MISNFNLDAVVELNETKAKILNTIKQELPENQ